jgi:hypothetical protein
MYSLVDRCEKKIQDNVRFERDPIIKHTIEGLKAGPWVFIMIYITCIVHILGIKAIEGTIISLFLTFMQRKRELLKGNDSI